METVGLKTMTCKDWPMCLARLKQGPFFKELKNWSWVLVLAACLLTHWPQTIFCGIAWLMLLYLVAYSTMELTKYLLLWGDIWKTCAKYTAVKQGFCQYQKVYKFLLKYFLVLLVSPFRSLKVSLSSSWYKYLWKGPSNFPYVAPSKRSRSAPRRI